MVRVVRYAVDLDDLGFSMSIRYDAMGTRDASASKKQLFLLFQLTELLMSDCLLYAVSLRAGLSCKILLEKLKYLRM